MAHLQHFYGFAEGGQDSRCPTASDDTNGDGVIDSIEPEPVTGTTMVPCHANSVSIEIIKDTYLTADAHVSYSYEKTVYLKALQDAFAPKIRRSAA